MSLPNFLCIGAQRSGTTWLYQMLCQHPDIFMSERKELHFFDEKPDFSHYQGVGNFGDRFYYDMNSWRHWHWYRKQFRKGKKYKARGEITPFYATLSEQRVALIAEKLKDLKIIYILRNPIKRAWSGFQLFWYRQYKEEEYCLENELLLNTIMYPAKLIHGDYKRNTDVWERQFGRGRILYLFYDDIVERPQDVLDTVFDFLRVPPLKLPAVTISERINKVPGVDMPEFIENALTDYYTGQISFIRTRFGRELKY